MADQLSKMAATIIGSTQLAVCRTLDRKVAGSKLTRTTVLYRCASSFFMTGSTHENVHMTEKMLTRTKSLNPNKNICESKTRLFLEV